jgi:Tfp pilus assembly protein PilF
MNQTNVMDQCDALAMTDDSRGTRRRAGVGDGSIMVLIVAVLAYMAFAPVRKNGFVTWDDLTNFLANEEYRGLGPSQVAWAWSTFRLGVYQPLAWMLLEAQYVAFGVNPAGYHLVSLVLYMVNSMVLYALVVALLSRCCPDRYRREPQAARLAAGLAVALFAVHPLRAEVVAWASCQPYLPCALFTMLAVLAYLHAHDTSPASAAWMFAAWVSFAAALLCKGAAIGLPAILLILDVYPLRRLGTWPGNWFDRATWAVWAQKVPFVALSLIFALIAVLARRADWYLVSLKSVGVPERLIQSSYGVWFYLAKTVVPTGLVPYYPLPRSDGLNNLWYALAALGMVGLSTWLIRRRRTWPGSLAAWIGYLALLAPNSGIVRSVTDQISADRYSYISLMPLVVLLAYGLWRLLGAGRRDVGVVGLVMAAAVVLLALSQAQCRVWATSISLWTHTVQHFPPSNPMAYKQLAGAYLYERGDTARAKECLAKALRIDPSLPILHIDWGDIELADDRYDEAEAHYKQAACLDPRNDRALTSLGALSLRRGRFEEAERWFTAALQAHSESPDALYGLGLVAVKRGDFAEAHRLFTHTLRVDPEHVGASHALDDPEGELREASRPGGAAAPDRADGRPVSTALH